jgi:hypothetical protein
MLKRLQLPYVKFVFFCVVYVCDALSDVSSRSVLRDMPNEETANDCLGL